MDKGTRVQIVGGRKGLNETGEIFWKGPNKYGPGERYGVRGDNGETYWVLEDDIETSTTAPPVFDDDGRTWSKGDRVRLVADPDVVGAVFWTGDSRAGGQRLGLKREDDGETVWIDARFVEDAGDAPVRTSASDEPVRAMPEGHQGGDGIDDEMPHDWSQPVAMDEMPPPPPIADADAERWATEIEDEDGL